MSENEAVLSALAPARRRVVLVFAALVAVALVLVGASLIVQAVSGGRFGAAGTAPQVPQDQPGPVLLVPGYGGSVAALNSLARVLTAEGKDVTVVRLPEDGLGDLRVQARALGAEAGAARARTGAPSVDVVGYSAGGVVARYWVQELDGRPQTRRLVTLGSPNHGTEVAELGTLFGGGCPLACQQLLPTSPLLGALDKEVGADGPRVVSIWTTVDDVVLPPDSARLAGAVNVTVQGVCATSRVRHSALPGDPVVQRIVGAQLGAGPPPQLGPDDCGRLSS
jgi:triacylglycerol esterase/lipase EstA (alpha/beta hydrolase family)